MKYIDAEKLITEIKRYKNKADNRLKIKGRTFSEEQKDLALQNLCGNLLHFIDSLQQEQPDDVCSVIKEYYGKELPFEDERTKAANHFFSAGRAFELKKIEEERVKHITDLLDNYQKGKKAGYKEAISELKEGKIECSPVMKELIDKLFGIGNAFNFGFGPKDFQQKQQVDLEKEIDLEWKKCEPTDEGMGLESANIVNEQFNYIASHFFNLGLNARKEENK